MSLILRKQLQYLREENFEMQKEFDVLVRQRDDAMYKADKFAKDC